MLGEISSAVRRDTNLRQAFSRLADVLSHPMLQVPGAGSAATCPEGRGRPQSGHHSARVTQAGRAGHPNFMRYFAQTDGRKLLEEYRRKRNFRRTHEPAGATEHPARPEHEPVFVVQKHDASRLHYDFRLEVDGVLKSWAIPKGPSMNTRDKRLAVPTEDHPLEYRDFEGIIPDGEYGAGRVIVWDTGSFRNITKRDGQLVPLHQAIENGQVAIWLEGKKLKGGFALTRIRDGKKPIWLLVKKRGEYANLSDPVNQQPESVLSGRTIEELDETQTAA